MSPRYVKHRVNRAADLAAVDPAWGVEIDLRSDVAQPGALHLSHDAWSRGEPFEAWLKAWVARGLKGPLILNTKEDGLEKTARALIERYQVLDWFFLDTALPTLVQQTRGPGLHPFAVRFSRAEPLEAVRAFAGRCRWVWVDCFDGVAMDAAAVATLKQDFQVCLVSPELQLGLGAPLDAFGGLFPLADAICTKDPGAWQRRFGS